ncbi:substrate-binding periplasmic protein [Fluviispira multicolorata]|uniref:Transporter substrate-binding domain-containing protein n=1 Tax=Fluviispira multicolorata TaxID=2654512 RepID=A0A833N0S9_9BACT|nr:transporter substrate-binding domain-containing protein [Fluviispira multicolorata]KAB8029196.1 transporter substrate-binding domain-containing protein [Fluviispira multicolorata]
MGIISKLVIALLNILVYYQCSASEIEKVKICWEDGLKPPYLMLKVGKKTENESVTGVAVEIVHQILKKNKIEYENIILPWKRCLIEVEKGKIDIVPNASINPERQAFAFFTDKPLYSTNMVLFYKKKRFKKKPIINGIDDLKKYIVGGYLGFNYKYFNNQIEMDIGSTSRELLFQKLKIGRFDFAIEQLEVVNYMASQKIISLNGLDYIQNRVMPQQHYYVMVSKNSENSTQLKSILDKGIEELLKNNSIQKLIKKYNAKKQ